MALNIILRSTSTRLNLLQVTNDPIGVISKWDRTKQYKVYLIEQRILNKNIGINQKVDAFRINQLWEDSQVQAYLRATDFFTTGPFAGLIKFSFISCFVLVRSLYLFIAAFYITHPLGEGKTQELNRLFKIISIYKHSFRFHI